MHIEAVRIVDMSTSNAWVRAKSTLVAADAKYVEDSFEQMLMEFERAGVVGKARSRKSARPSDPSIDKSKLSHPEPRRIRDREHVRFVT